MLCCVSFSVIDIYSCSIIISTLQFVGDNDDVLDIKFMGNNDSHVAVATNSPLVRVFSMETWACQVLRGHSDIVMALDVSHESEMLVTGSKVRAGT